MLTLIVKGLESFDDETQMFSTSDDVVLELEHSLVSLSKWESEWEKPFLTKDAKSQEELLGYFQAMSLNGEIPGEVLSRLTDEHVLALNAYIESKMTATWFRDVPKTTFNNTEVVTAEIIYHWMVALQIDWECQYWHLNRLITLVKTINEKNKAATDTKKKAPTRSDLDNRRSLMAQRRAEAGGKG